MSPKRKPTHTRVIKAMTTEPSSAEHSVSASPHADDDVVPSISRESVHTAQRAAGLTVADVVVATLPGGEEVTVWGRDMLRTVVQAGVPAGVLMSRLRLPSMDAAQSVHDAYEDAFANAVIDSAIAAAGFVGNA